MHLEHSVHNRPLEEMEKNYTALGSGGGKKIKKTSAWTAMLRGNLKLYWGKRGRNGGAGGDLLFLLSCTCEMEKRHFHF